MDSQSYRFIYPISTNSDIPADFPKETRESSFGSGVFLPQDDSNWYTRPPQFPARVLLLRDQSISIISHPTSGQAPVEIAFCDLTQLETGNVLLSGWMKFTTRGSVYEITYNTRASHPLERFVASLRGQWLRDGSPCSDTPPVFFGDDLDLKFRNLLHAELSAGEIVLLQYFQPPVKTERKHLLWKRVHWRPGDLLVLTSENRLLWITDDYRRHRELYAAVCRSSPARVFQSCGVESTGTAAQIAISLQDDSTWRIPIRSSTGHAAAFSEALGYQFPRLRTPHASRSASE